ncbi:Extracellular metalloprotease [Seminavis robusta]|uniref:Extracellular metalloprotease n=1 Tax=Seminavis robusta TaxID=568900 RepID=A0A9N8DSE9_9STRA|nr:Extracellular metalloprotease [Seminavis robusta]|eukprot:Sro248_g098430.1 Extracellular metalloprotease (1111) ;mRNA; f:65438-69322
MTICGGYRRVSLSFLFLALVSSALAQGEHRGASAYAQYLEDHPEVQRTSEPELDCSTPRPNKKQILQVEHDLQKWKKEHGEMQPENLIIVQTVWHNIQLDNGEGGVTTEEITATMQYLNEQFAPAGFTFNLDDTTTSQNSSWYFHEIFTAEEFEMKEELKVEGDGLVDQYAVLNIYSTGYFVATGSYGYSYHPFVLETFPETDGVVIDGETVVGGVIIGRNGTNLVHMVGHWLGLYEVFDEVGNECAGFGDYIPDTPPQAEATTLADGCPLGKDTCPGDGLDSVKNFMDFSSCREEFTPFQIARMIFIWNLYRCPNCFDSTLPPLPPVTAPTLPPTPTCPPGSSSFLLDLKTDQYGEESTWDIENTCTGSTVRSGGPYGDLLQYFESGCLPDDQVYVFTFYDDFDDGICCFYGEGAFGFYYNDELALQGAIFEDQESVFFGADFCPSGAPITMAPVAPTPPTDPPTLPPFASCPSGETLFVLDLLTDEFGDETTWDIINTCTSSVVAAGGPYDNLVQIFETRCLTSGFAYEFTIYDDPFGDGICCEYGDGAYNLYYGGENVGSGGVFEFFETTPFGAGSCAPSAPVPAPTVAPPTNLCPSGTSAFNLELFSDFYGYENTWQVQDTCNGVIMLSGGNDPEFDSNTEYFAAGCLDSSRQYTFTIFDSFGDGMCCDYGFGYWEVYYEGESVGDGDIFESEDTADFGAPFCPSSPTTPPPTPAPTLPIFPACAPGSDQFVLDLVTDHYGIETTWKLERTDSGEVVLDSGGTIGGEGPYASNSQFFVDTCLEDRYEYTFTIYDYFGEGICCQEGTGSYTVYLNGLRAFEGGEFEFVQSNTFGSVRNDVCFSEVATVPVQRRGPTRMTELTIGDSVFTADGYHHLYAFAHQDNQTSSEFLQIHTKEFPNRPLEVTRQHLLFLHATSRAVPAESIQPGDVLQSSHDGQDGVMVKRITRIHRKGIYAPLTTSGTVVVDGIVSSCYASLQRHAGEFVELRGGIKTALTQHFVAHMAMSPVRMACIGISERLCSTYDKDGLAVFAKLGFAIAEFAEKKPLLVQIILLVVFLVLFGSLFALELIFGPKMSLVILILGFLAAVAHRGRMYCRGNCLRKQKSD